jgi:Flp pilus assembly protein protease CpaA|tara:strand:+ start:503 stop:682 length:180 start_codon:yes stop_codon:yes gene_type:complete
MGLLKIIWLLLSSFGIMFAFLSWLQESNLIANDLGFYKGLFALILGLVLFFAVPSRMGK